MRAQGWSPRNRATTFGAILVGVAALALLVPVLELWDADFSVPFAYVYEPPNGYVYSLDAPFYLMLAKGGLDHAWFLTNPDLGWPLGQQVHDLPQTLDNLNLFGLKVLGVVFGDVGTTVNVFYVLTFAAIAIAAFLVLCALRVTAPTAFVVALLYAFLPYHFARGVPHLFLSAYWVVPLAVYLMLRVVSDRPPLTAERDTARGFGVRFLDRSGVLWVLACVAIASSGAYYAVFTVALLAVITVVDYVANRRLRVLVSGALVVATVGVVAAANLLPTLLYWQEHGENDALFRRLPYETEYEGLKVSQLLLPIPGHRFAPFAETQADSTRFTPVPSEEGQHLGMIGALGFLGVLAALFLAARRPGANGRRTEPVGRASSRDDAARAPPSDGFPSPDGLRAPVVLRTLGVLTISAILLATVSGFSLLVSGAGFREIRSWNRIVVFVAFFAFVAVAYGLDWLARRLPDRPWRIAVVAVGLAVVLAVGILDQVSPASIPDYAATQARWASDAAFVAAIERELPPGAAVFQLPYRFFPEARQVGELGPYDLVRGYLHSDGVHWGWGGVRGRGADWQQNVVRRPADEFLDRIVAVGFEGLELDRFAGVAAGAPGEEEITEIVGRPTTVSRDRQLVFWDLRDYAADVRDRLGADGIAELRAETLADVPAVRAEGS